MEALEKMAQTPVDLVVTDLNMPKLDGFRLGANSYWVKPFDQRRIQYEIAKYIN